MLLSRHDERWTFFSSTASERWKISIFTARCHRRSQDFPVGGGGWELRQRRRREGEWGGVTPSQPTWGLRERRKLPSRQRGRGGVSGFAAFWAWNNTSGDSKLHIFDTPVTHMLTTTGLAVPVTDEVIKVCLEGLWTWVLIMDVNVVNTWQVHLVEQLQQQHTGHFAAFMLHTWKLSIVPKCNPLRSMSYWVIGHWSLVYLLYL